MGSFGVGALYGHAYVWVFANDMTWSVYSVSGDWLVNSGIWTCGYPLGNCVKSSVAKQSLFSLAWQVLLA